MFAFLTVIVFVWLLVKGVGLALRLTWGAATLIAGLLTVLALPLLVVCVLFVGGAFLLLPIALIGAAVGILKACA